MPEPEDTLPPPPGPSPFAGAVSQALCPGRCVPGAVSWALCPHLLCTHQHKVLLVSSFSRQAAVRSLLGRTCLNDVAKWSSFQTKMETCPHTHVNNLPTFSISCAQFQTLINFSPITGPLT